MKIVCVSDTHNRHRKLVIPPADMLIVAGDFSTHGYSRTEVRRFGNWIRSLGMKYNIVIGGNHDRMFEDDPEQALKLLGEDIIYLKDREITIEGVKFYGTPYQPEFCGWAFNLPRGEALKEKWDLIPDDTDILITHGPPRGILDLAPPFHTDEMTHEGCDDLLVAVKRVKPKYHIFGHIHGSYGRHEEDGITFLNVASCTEEYTPDHLPVLFEIDGE